MFTFSDPALDEMERSSFRKRRLIGLTRLITSVLCLVISLAMIGSLGQSIAFYNDSKHAAEWGIGIWPAANLDVAPSVGLLAVASITAALNLGFILAGASTLTRPLKSVNIVAIAVGFFSLIAVVAGLGFFFSRHNDISGLDNFVSWSCRFDMLPNASAPLGMGRTCMQSRYGIYATIPLAILEGLFMALTAIDFAIAQKVSRHIREQDIKSIDESSRKSSS